MKMKIEGDTLILNYKGNSTEAKAARIAANIILSMEGSDMPQPALDYYLDLITKADDEAWDEFTT